MTRSSHTLSTAIRPSLCCLPVRLVSIALLIFPQFFLEIHGAFQTDTFTELTNDIANAFEPPAKNNQVIGVYYVDCDARAPDIAIVINGTSFWLNPEDLIVQSSIDPEHTKGPCFIVFNDGGAAGSYILGSAFLKKCFGSV